MIPHLDCCNSLLYGCKKSSIQCLQCLQNYTTRVICKVSKYDHIARILKELPWLPVQARIEYKLLTLSVLSNVSMIKPQHICLNLFFAVFPPLLVSALWTISLYLYQKLLPKRAFSLSTPKLWNTLPTEIRNTRTLIDFKRELKTFIWKIFLIVLIRFFYLIIICT